MKQKIEELRLVCISNNEDGIEKIIAFSNRDNARKCLKEQHDLYLKDLIDYDYEIIDDYCESYEWKIETNFYGKSYYGEILSCEWGEPDGN